MFPLAPEARIGISLLAAIPGAPIALQFTRQAKKRWAFTATVTFVHGIDAIDLQRVLREPRSIDREVGRVAANRPVIGGQAYSGRERDKLQKSCVSAGRPVRVRTSSVVASSGLEA